MSESPLGALLVGISVTGTNELLVNELLSALGAFGLAATPNAPPPSSGMHFGGQGIPLPAKIFIGAKPLANP